MAADATLVNAAFREAQTGAMADVPSMAPMFESQKRVQKTYMDTITSVMKTLEVKKEQKEIAKVQQLKPVKETIQKAYNALEQGEPLPQFVVNDFTKQIEDLQDQFEKVNTEGKGDTRANEQERRRITARLTRLKNQAIDLRSKYMIAFQDPSSYNEPNIKGEDIDAFNSIATAFSDPDASAEMFKNGSIRGGFVNGEYTIFTKDYSTGTRKVRLKDPESTFLTDDDLLDEEEYKYGDERGFTGSDMVNALPYKNLQNDQNTANFLKPAPEAGKTDAINGVANKYLNEDGTSNLDARNAEIAEFFDLVKTDEDYYDMQARRMEGTGMAPSFDQALGGMAAIPISVLNNMFLDAQGNPVTDMATYFSELDKKGNKDGKINSGDFPEDGDALKTFMNNIEITKEEILKNKEIGLPLMAEYFADMKIKAYNDNYTANTPEGTTRPGRATTTTTTPKVTPETTLENFSHTTGPEGVKVWTAPAAKQAAFNFFSKKHKPGDVYDGTHAYYAQIGKDRWNAYSSINDYNEHKKTGNPELKKGTYTQAQIIGFESGMNIESSNKTKVKSR